MAMLVVVSLLACTGHSSARSEDQMRTALGDLAGAENVYFANNLRYSDDPSIIMSLTLPPGVAVSIESADESGWSAFASHSSATGGCSQLGRNDGNDAFAVLEGPTCSASPHVPKLRPAPARRPTISAPATGDAPAPIASVSLTDGTTAEATSLGGSVLLPVIEGHAWDFGYPTQTVDRLAVRRLLFARNYDALDALLAAYADSVARDFRLEYRLFDAYSSFHVAVPAWEPFLSEWVRQRPTSAAALLARATFYEASGWAARGGGYRSQTSSQQFGGMREFFRLSVADLTAALRLEPNSIVAFRELMDIASTSQRSIDRSRQILERALAIQPYSFVLRETHMYNLLPRWGGSYEAMARFAEESSPYADRNPRIQALRGFVDWDRGRLIEDKGNKERAIEAYRRALRFGDYSQFHYERGWLYSRSDRKEQALEDLNAVLIQDPQYDDALYERSGVTYELGRRASNRADKAVYFRQAFRDIELAAALDPTDAYYQKRLAHTRKNIPQYAPSAIR